MNIEEAKNCYLELKPCEKWIESIEPSFFFEFAETVITAYEKEKEAHEIDNMEFIDTINSQKDVINKWDNTIKKLKSELEKEKEKNKKARDMIEYYLIENNSLNDFDKRNKELKKLEKVLEE